MTSFFKLLLIFLYAYFTVIDNEPLFALNAKKKRNPVNRKLIQPNGFSVPSSRARMSYLCGTKVSASALSGEALT